MSVMSYLSTALSDYLSAQNLTQAAFAEQASITVGQVNRACRGSTRVKAPTIHAFLRALPADQRGVIAAGWLKDQLKPDLLAIVDINAIGATVREQPPAAELPPELDAETRALIIWLAHQAVLHTAVRDALRSLKRAAEAVTS
jgi:transcriptional regulator with XRE-family HTH domain